MGLTLVSSGQLISAATFNQFTKLLTGDSSMGDQAVTLLARLGLSPISGPPTLGSMAGTLTSGTNLGVGVYKYYVTFVDSQGGETPVSSALTVTTTSGNQKVNLTGIPTGPTGTSKRKVYRSLVGGTTGLLLTTLNDNSTTAYTDITADASLGAVTPSHPSFGGSLVVKDASGTVKFQLYNDGYFSLTQPLQAGDVSGTPYYGVMRAKSGTTPGRAIWIAPTGSDPTTADGLQEGDLVFSF